jgi:hypothetical protein
MSDLSREARALIENARPAERPDPSAKRRVHAALAVQLAMPPPAPPFHGGPAAGPAVAGAAVGGGTKLALVLTLGTTALVGTGAGLHRWATAHRGPATSAYHVPSPRSAMGQAPSRGPVPPQVSPEDSPQPPSLDDQPLPVPAIRPAPLILAKADSRTIPETAERASLLARGRAPNANPTFAKIETGQPSNMPAPIDRGVVQTHGPASSPYPPAVTFASEPPPLVPDRRPSVEPRVPAFDPHPSSVGPGQTGCSARDELKLLAAAQIALRERRGTTALAMLDAHNALCPSARFREEHSTAHVLALCLLGQREQALAEAAALAALAPRSPQLARLRTSCAAAAVQKAAGNKGVP